MVNCELVWVSLELEEEPLVDAVSLLDAMGGTMTISMLLSSLLELEPAELLLASDEDESRALLLALSALLEPGTGSTELLLLLIAGEGSGTGGGRSGEAVCNDDENGRPGPPALPRGVYWCRPPRGSGQG